MPPRKIEYRTESDELGQQSVPLNAYWGAQTARCLASGVRVPDMNPKFLEALLYFQKALVLTNVEQGRLEQSIGRTIGQAVDEVIAGQWQDQFVVGCLQAGAVNEIIANVREVLANRAGEILGSTPGSYTIVQPQQHIGLLRNTADDFAASLQVALLLLQKDLESVLRDLERMLRRKALEFDRSARNGSNGSTNGDSSAAATSMFNGYGSDVARICRKISELSSNLSDLYLPKSDQPIIDKLSLYTSLNLRISDDSGACQSAMCLLEFSASLRMLAIFMNNMIEDLRSIKSVDQEAAEFVSMVCYQIIGLDSASASLAQSGKMGSNSLLGLSAHNLLFSIELLKQTLLIFNQRCIAGISTSATLAVCI